MNGFALDSNIISFYLKDNETVRRNIDQKLQVEVKVYTPPFAYYEVKRGLVAANATRRLRSFDDLLQRCPRGEATNAVFDAAVDIHVALKTKGRICDDMDILIAAFCQTYGLTLVTNNTRHFENIPGLALVDWSAIN
ncbi:MAG: PIN domain-containing protein [Treponema sp.]|jgi:predicted nucleic acid-binding protein|nr:PIN domain-containing protein [Treponema sp.]